MNTIYLVIANCGDGSAVIEFYCDPASITKLETFARDGDERYASGEGLQVTKINVPCSLEEFGDMQPHWYGYADGDLVYYGEE